MTSLVRSPRLLRAMTAVVCVVLFIGCQEPNFFPVQGVLVDDEGQPLTELAGAAISFEAKSAPVSAVAEVRPDASFTMTTETTDDGCLPGEHRVSISRVFRAADAPQPRVIDAKYENYETSGLTVTVEKKRNELKLELTRVK